MDCGGNDTALDGAGIISARRTITPARESGVVATAVHRRFRCVTGLTDDAAVQIATYGALLLEYGFCVPAKNWKIP